NLIGDHTDYNDGFCLPLAIDRECVVAGAPTSGDRITFRSQQLPGEVDIAADGRDDPGRVEPRWGGFVAGVVRTLRTLGWEATGFDGTIASTGPPGSGLSSSSALSVALTLALAEAGNFDWDDLREVARAALDAEVLATGVPGGLMDQLCSLFGVADHALLLDCRSLSITPVPLPRNHAVLVVHSGIARTLAGSAYAERRAACEAAAARLGVLALRDATLEQVRDDPIARHVVAENQRVLDFVRALEDDDTNALGPLLLASHASLRDDYAVSTPELDLLVELLVDHGAIGARLTGAGFGGCVVALVQRNHADDCAARTLAAYSERTGRTGNGFVVRAVDGAGPADGAPSEASR
ncbi:MAG: galactokinase, partial [Acidimicrobiia bacterium]